MSIITNLPQVQMVNRKIIMIALVVLAVLGGLVLVSIDGIEADELTEILSLDIFGHNKPPDHCANVPKLTAEEWDRVGSGYE